jgi:hypothetical protein
MDTIRDKEAIRANGVPQPLSHLASVRAELGQSAFAAICNTLTISSLLSTVVALPPVLTIIIIIIIITVVSVGTVSASRDRSELDEWRMSEG